METGKTASKYIKAFIITFVILTLTIISLVFVVDPLFQYHGPWITKTPYLYNQVYQAPGLARNMTYDSVIVGNSMTENFESDWFDDELGWNTLKSSYSGARTKDLDALLEQIFLSNNEVKHVIMNLDYYQFEVDSETLFAIHPSHLYSASALDDAPYLLNIDNVKTSAEILIKESCGQSLGNMSHAYSWSAADGVDISAGAVLRDCEINNQNATPTAIDTDAYQANIERNLAHITKHIDAHPETEFIIYISPYSVMYWETCMLGGKFDIIMNMSEYVIRELLTYPNVSVYYFQNIEEIVTNLSLYRDTIHYNGDINRYMFDSFKTQKHQVFQDTYKEEISKTKDLALSFNYQAVWDEYYGVE